jgi:hypothetical protein
MNAVEHDTTQKCPLCRADITESLRTICGNDLPPAEPRRVDISFLLPILNLLRNRDANGNNNSEEKVEQTVELSSPSHSNTDFTRLFTHANSASERLDTINILPGYCRCMESIKYIRQRVRTLQPEIWTRILAYAIHYRQNVFTTPDQLILERDVYERKQAPPLYGRPNMELLFPITPEDEVVNHQFVQAIVSRRHLIESAASLQNFSNVEAEHADIGMAIRCALIWLGYLTPCASPGNVLQSMLNMFMTSNLRAT